jgi:hypothetical protein
MSLGDNILNKASGVVGNLGKKITSPLGNQNLVQGEAAKILSSGVNKDKANAMFAKDISNSEQAVRQVLKSNGVTKVPQNVFDGLVSYHNQVGDITYAYVKGEKIDLTGLYRAGDWNRAASFIAADERDRSRRIKESSMIYGNKYGTPPSDDVIVDKGLDKTRGDIAKGILNRQTGDAANAQQIAAMNKVLFDQKGVSLPNTDFPTLKQVTQDKLGSLLGKRAGTIPY